MTFDLTTVPPIAGESAMRIWDILRRSQGAFREDWLSHTFRYDRRRAEELASAWNWPDTCAGTGAGTPKQQSLPLVLNN